MEGVYRAAVGMSIRRGKDFCRIFFGGREGARQALRRLHPDASEAELDEWLLRERYGAETAREVVELKRRQGYYDRSA